jgi:SAM-dependent methyltransferase
LQPEWFENFFRGVAVEFWNRATPPAITLIEVDFLEKALAPIAGASLLDIPCGSGRHSVELARRGYGVTGVDLSADFLHLARVRAEEAQASVELRHGDMRNPALDSDAFDGAFCVGNSFPYLDRTGVIAFLTALKKAVRPGGRLVIDTGCAAESILPTLLPQRWHSFDDIIVMSKANYVASASRLDIDYTFIQDGKIETRPSSSYVFTVAEMTRMLTSTGFAVVSLAGGFAGERYDLGTPRLVLTAERVTDLAPE